MTIPNYPSPEVKAFGERVNAAMYGASIRQSMGGLGGCKDFDLSDFDADLHPYIEAYLQGNLDSVAVTYAAMRTKELELAAEAASQPAAVRYFNITFLGLTAQGVKQVGSTALTLHGKFTAHAIDKAATSWKAEIASRGIFLAGQPVVISCFEIEGEKS